VLDVGQGLGVCTERDARAGRTGVCKGRGGDYCFAPAVPWNWPPSVLRNRASMSAVRKLGFNRHVVAQPGCQLLPATDLHT